MLAYWVRRCLDLDIPLVESHDVQTCMCEYELVRPGLPPLEDDYAVAFLAAAGRSTIRPQSGVVTRIANRFFMRTSRSRKDGSQHAIKSVLVNLVAEGTLSVRRDHLGVHFMYCSFDDTGGSTSLSSLATEDGRQSLEYTVAAVVRVHRDALLTTILENERVNSCLRALTYDLIGRKYIVPFEVQMQARIASVGVLIAFFLYGLCHFFWPVHTHTVAYLFLCLSLAFSVIGMCTCVTYGPFMTSRGRDAVALVYHQHPLALFNECATRAHQGSPQNCMWQASAVDFSMEISRLSGARIGLYFALYGPYILETLSVSNDVYKDLARALCGSEFSKGTSHSSSLESIFSRFEPYSEISAGTTQCASPVESRCGSDHDG